MSKGLCTKCKYRIKCSTLCSIAQTYADQDQVGGDAAFTVTHNVLLYADPSVVAVRQSPWDEGTVFCEEAVKLAGLSKFETEVLLLRLGNFSYAEIGIQLHTVEKAVKNALYRARQRLRKDLLANSRGLRFKLIKRRD